MSYFCFSSSMFLHLHQRRQPTEEVYLLCLRFPKLWCCPLSFSGLFQHHPPVLQKFTLPPTFSGTSNSFSAHEENCQLWHFSEIFFFYSDRTLAFAGFYIAVSCLLSLLIKTTEQVCDLNYLCQKKHWAARMVPSICAHCSPSWFFTNKSYNAFLSLFIQYFQEFLFL